MFSSITQDIIRNIKNLVILLICITFVAHSLDRHHLLGFEKGATYT